MASSPTPPTGVVAADTALGLGAAAKSGEPSSTPPPSLSAAVDKSGATVEVHEIDDDRFDRIVAALQLLRAATMAASEALGIGATGSRGADPPVGLLRSLAEANAGVFDADVKRIRAEPSFRINPRRYLLERETTPSLARSFLAASLTTVSRPRASVCCVRDCCLASRPDTWNGDPDHCDVHVYGL
jgi:hypothetical protein